MKRIASSLALLLLPLLATAQQLQKSNISEPGLSDFANLHPMVVHLPIVLLFVALATQIASFFTWKPQLDVMTLLTLLGGVIGAFLAAEVFHPHARGLDAAAQHIYEEHDTYASWTLWLSVVALIMKAASYWFLKGKLWLEIVLTVVLAGSAAAVAFAAHEGAALVYIHGVGVQGNYVEGD